MDLKHKVAEHALANLPLQGVVGVGTGTTVNAWIERLDPHAAGLEGAVASSLATEQRLRAQGIPVLAWNDVDRLSLYIDGADQVNALGQLIKGGGGALTREKILAQAADVFYCMVDESKCGGVFGSYPLAVEVLDWARSSVARELQRWGGQVVYRQGFVTDNGHVILDIHHLDLKEPMALEVALNQIPGIIAHGLFAKRQADVLWIAKDSEVQTIRFEF